MTLCRGRPGRSRRNWRLKVKIAGRLTKRPSSAHPAPAHWAELRAAALSAAGHACRCCPASEAEGYALELHHRHYDTFGAETLEDVTVLCRQCHEAIHSRLRQERINSRRFLRVEKQSITVAISPAFGRVQMLASIALQEWSQQNLNARSISTQELHRLFKAYKIDRRRKREVIISMIKRGFLVEKNSEYLIFLDRN